MGHLVFAKKKRTGQGSRLDLPNLAGPRLSERRDDPVVWCLCIAPCRRLPQHRCPALELEHRGVWRQLVFDRVHMLEGDLAALWTREPVVATEVDRLLSIAWEAARQPSGLVRWWQGTLIDRAWLAVHDAEVLLTRHLEAERAAERWQAVVGRRPRCEVPWGACTQHVPEQATHAIAQSLEIHHNASDRRYTETRLLRNRLLIYSSLGLVFVVVLIALAATGVVAFDVFAGGREFALIAGFGAIGAYVVHLPSILKAAPQRSPYSVAWQQLTVKLAVGPLFALLGVMVLQSGLLDQMRPFESFGVATLVWATIFGGSQQVLTGLIDRRASDLMVEDTDRDRDRDLVAPIAMVS